MQKTIFIKSGLFVAFAVMAISPVLMQGTKGDTPNKPTEQWGANLITVSEPADSIASNPSFISTAIQIPEDINHPNITAEEIKRGWYSASKEGRKYGTPASWVFISDSSGPKWANSEGQQEAQASTHENLCEQTGGQHDGGTDSDCTCSESTAWQEGQGCILKGTRGSLITISQEEIDKGFYEGSIREKKLNTPTNWHWLSGEKSGWQKP